MLVRPLKMLPIEGIIRGYLSGSGFKEYCTSQSICSIRLPSGLVESERLPDPFFPLFTPSTKADLGTHDENISPDRAGDIIGKDLVKQLENTAKSIYLIAYEYALSKGIIIADTKFEFGIEGANLILGDEVLTPDSSRFWPSLNYSPGRAQDSYDKQYVRDYLESIHFNKKDPVVLPAEIVNKTLEKYIEIYRILTGNNPEL